MASFESNVLDRWPAGTKLSVFPRLGDAFSNALDEVKSVTVPKDGAVKITGLDEGPYWLAGEGRAVAFSIKDQAAKPQSALSRMAQKHGGLQSAAPGYTTEPNTVTGARSSADIKRRHQPVLTDDKRELTDAEPQPHVNQLDVKGVVQRSDTAFGQATPKDPKEEVPRPSQSDVGARELQRSATEFGEATPKPRDEVEPALSQEDVKRGTVQRSDTELGSAEPKAVQSRAKVAKKQAVEAERVRDSSAAKAVGSTEQQDERQVSRKASKK